MVKKVILVISLAAWYGCSDRIRAYAEYDNEFHLNNYSTFGWVKKKMVEPGKDSLFNTGVNETRIRTAVQKQLEVRGYTLVTDQPDFNVYYHIIVNDQTIITPETYHYGPYWMQLGTDTFPYGAGTFVVDIMDAKTNTLTWRGWAVAPIDVIEAPEKIDELIKTTVGKIFKKFPNTPKHTFVRDDKI